MAKVQEIIEEMKSNPSTRFSYSDWGALILAILSDPDFRAKRYLLRNNELVETEADIRGAFKKFLHKVLKHAGMEDRGERERVIETFEFNARDLEWVSDTVDEAMSLYVESGRNMRIFRDKALQLSLKKMERSGKHAGKTTYKKSVVDRALALRKRIEKIEAGNAE